MIYHFMIGRKYRRKDIYRIIGIPENTKGGSWDTGYNKYKDDWFLFCNIGIPGRTGHDYENEFIGDDLKWFGKTGSKLAQPSIQSMLKPKGQIYIFTRTDQTGPFTYAGAGVAIRAENTTPVQIIWRLTDTDEVGLERLPEEVVDATNLYEGATKSIKVNTYERNPIARQICIEHYGLDCSVCGFNFGKKYGELGKDYIHVHHLKALHEIGSEYQVDPIKDLRPICPNCHSMIHRHQPPLSIDELKKLIVKEDA